MDAADYVFPLKNSSSKTFVECAWISKNEKKIDSRQAEYCQSSAVAYGFPINDPASDTASDCDDDLSPTDDDDSSRR